VRWHEKSDRQGGRALAAVSRAVGISREELIAFLDERAALTYVAMLRLAMHLWAGSRIFTGYLDQLRPSARRRVYSAARR
jgi:hypothetical protein